MDVTPPIADGAPETLIVDFEGDDTRIQLNEAQKTVWTKDDQVSVFYRSNANQLWKYTGETGERTAVLKCVDTGNATESMKRVVVVYPYNENYYINTETYNVQASLPATQHYLADSYGLDGNIMISSAEYNQVTLKNVCGWLKLQLTGEGEVVNSITFKGNNGEQVAGELYINSADATSVLASDMGNIAEDEGENVTGSAGANLSFDDVALTEVTLDCGEGVTLGSEATAFYIALPPQTFEKGFTVEIEDANGYIMEQSTNKAIAIERNTIQPMAEFEYEGYILPVYELAYTTNDGQPLDPYTTDGFGANFVENVYDAATGKGALKFDGTITTIPEKAFVACINLTQIDLPVGITAINAEAFSGCKALEVVNIPQSVTTIGNKAFYNCSGVQEITIPSSVNNIGTSSFEGCGGKATINCKIPDGYYNSESNFFYNTKFTEILIGNDVTSIGSFAFSNCETLTNVIVGNSVTRIKSYAFSECKNLTSITIPRSVTTIESLVFSSCDNLKKVYYNGDLSDWCKIIFYRHYDTSSPHSNPCSHGAELYINGKEITEVIIPADITEIKGYTFDGCINITKVDIHNNVFSIKMGAFKNCCSLTSIIIPNRITSIEDIAFCGCNSLESVTIYTNRVTEIGRGTFAGCNSLTNITIPNSVTTIGYEAFSSCSSLTSVTIPNSVTEIGNYAFAYCSSLTSVTIPDSVTEIGDFAFDNCSSITSIEIPDSVTEIGDYTFRNCRNLTSVTISNNIITIDYGAFTGCSSLTCVVIPDSVTEIGSEAFYDCNNLVSTTIGNSVTWIGRDAFNSCTNLKEIYCKPIIPPATYLNYPDIIPITSGHSFPRNSGMIIYVPRGSYDTYTQYTSVSNGVEQTNWYTYKAYIEPYDF